MSLKSRINLIAAFLPLALLGVMKEVVEWWHFGPSQAVLRWFRSRTERAKDWANSLE